MKGVISIMAVGLVLLVIGIVAVSGVNFVGIGNIFSPANIQSGGQSCTPKYSLTALMGYYQCRQLASTFIDYNIPNSGLFDIGSPWSTQCDKFTTQCTCTTYERTSTGNKVLNTAIVNRGDYCTVKKTPIGDRFMRVSFQPYSLWLESRSGQSGWVNTNVYGCNLPSKDYCLSGILCDSDKLYKSGTLDFDQASNFLEQWVVSPIDFALVSYSGKDAFCSGQGNIYDYATVTLKSGCYAYPKNVIGKVDCCPNQVLGSAVCGSDFRWKTEDTNCGKLSVIQCTGGGTWVADYSDINRRTLTRYTLDSQGCCVIQTKQTECTTNEACPTGTVCLINQATGTGSCTTSGTPQTSPRAPNVIDAGWDLWSLILNFISSVIIAGIILGVLVIIGMFTPILNLIPFVKSFVMRLRNPRTFMIASVILGVVILIFYTGTVLSVSGMIFGG